MKKILITILLVIILIFAYNQYKDYQRHNPKNTDYKTSQEVDLNYYNPEALYSYNEAIQNLNSYVTMQWSANEIDVINPDDDDVETTLAVKEYAKKLAKVKYYEAKLEQSKQLKDKGFSNESIKTFEITGLSEEAYEKHIEAKKIKNRLMSALPNGNLRFGEKSAFIHEIQKLLVKKGYEIPVDGVYKSITQNAILDFETKNNLFSDGNIDELTLEALMMN